MSEANVMTSPATKGSVVKRFVMRFSIFMVVWIAGCAIADYVFLFEDRAWSMWWGYFVGVAAIGAQNAYDA